MSKWVPALVCALPGPVPCYISSDVTIATGDCKEQHTFFCDVANNNYRWTDDAIEGLLVYEV